MACFTAGVRSRTDNDVKNTNPRQNHVSHLDHDGLCQVEVGRGSKRRRWRRFRRMVWSLNILLFSGGQAGRPNAKRRGGSHLKGRKGRVKGGEEESKRLWLFEGTRSEEEQEGNGKVTVVEDPFQLTHSSFHPIIGSQAEVDGAKMGSFSSCSSVAAFSTVLLLNIEEEEGNVVEPASSSSDATQQRLLQPKCKWESLKKSISSIAPALVRFRYQEVQSAAGGFCEGRVLGRGALSCVYRGILRRGILVSRAKAVAIKRLRGPDKECAKQFCRELLVAGSLRNSNVVPILGYCIDREGLFLVYKYVPGGSLDLHLHPEGSLPVSENNVDSSVKNGGLSWDVRFKVAIGTARAVAYLHYGTDRCIVHRDIKPSNILLTSKKSPKLCDFGLAMWTHGPSLTFLCKNVKGTFGYLAPEYFQHGKLSDKTDVYAFGVVLLELITGRKSIDTTKPHGEENLVLWAKPFLQQGKAFLKHLVDPRLRSYNQNEMQRIMHAAAACLNNDESRRPRITEVIGMLRGKKENCGKQPFLAGNDGSSGYNCQAQDQPQKSDVMSDHLALAMLGVTDADEYPVIT